jgi:hypothetical protein
MAHVNPQKHRKAVMKNYLISLVTLSIVVSIFSAENPTYSLKQQGSKLTIVVTPSDSLSAARPQVTELQAIPVNIDINNVGIKRNDICGFAQVPAIYKTGPGATQGVVVCSSGTVFSNLGSFMVGPERGADALPLNTLGWIQRPSAVPLFLCNGPCQWRRTAS